MKWMPRLARVGHHVLARLAGEERVEARARRPACSESARRRRRRSRCARTRSGPGVEHERLALPSRRATRAYSSCDREPALGERAGAADRRPAIVAERLVRLAAERARRAARCCRPRDGRRAAGGSAARLMSCLNSGRSRSASAGVSPVGLEVPEQAVVDEHELGARSATARSISSRCADTPVTTRVTVRRAGHLEPVRGRSPRTRRDPAARRGAEISSSMLCHGGFRDGHFGRSQLNVDVRARHAAGAVAVRTESSARRRTEPWVGERVAWHRARRCRPDGDDGADPTSSLVAAVRRGDDRAFEALYQRYQRRIYAYVLGMVKDHGRAEDVTQEVFVSALRRMRADRAADRLQALDLRDRQERVHRRVPALAAAPRRSPTTPRRASRRPTTAARRAPGPSPDDAVAAKQRPRQPVRRVRRPVGRRTTRSSCCASSRVCRTARSASAWG